MLRVEAKSNAPAATSAHARALALAHSGQRRAALKTPLTGHLLSFISSPRVVRARQVAAATDGILCASSRAVEVPLAHSIHQPHTAHQWSALKSQIRGMGDARWSKKAGSGVSAQRLERRTRPLTPLAHVGHRLFCVRCVNVKPAIGELCTVKQVLAHVNRSAEVPKDHMGICAPRNGLRRHGGSRSAVESFQAVESGVFGRTSLMKVWLPLGLHPRGCGLRLQLSARVTDGRHGRVEESSLWTDFDRSGRPLRG